MSLKQNIGNLEMYFNPKYIHLLLTEVLHVFMKHMTKVMINVYGFLEPRLKTELIIKKINRKEIGIDKLKQSLKEVIAFKLIKIEELLHNYIDFYIKDKQLYVVLDFIDLVNKYKF